MLKQHTIWGTFAAYLAFLIGSALFERRRNRSSSARSFLTAGASHFRTSSSDSGAGRSARSVAPTNPVTPGVLRTQE